MALRRRHVLLIRREDHKRDALGAVFLGAVRDPDEVARYVERYLEPSLRVRSIELDDDVLRVVVEAPRFEEESQNLVRLGRGLVEQGRPRSAGDMFEEALKLDPLNVDALKELAGLLVRRGADERAVALWVRAGEVAGYDGTILRGLAGAALREGRTPSARRYLEEALLVNPEDRESREILAEIDRQTELRFRAHTEDEEEPSG